MTATCYYLRTIIPFNQVRVRVGARVSVRVSVRVRVRVKVRIRTLTLTRTWPVRVVHVQRVHLVVQG